MIRKSSDFREERRPIGGGSEVLMRHALSTEEAFGKTRICAEVVVPEGGWIGDHPHDGEMEIYYILSGELVVNDNGSKAVMRAGDIMSTGGGGFHGARNESGREARLLAVVIH